MPGRPGTEALIRDVGAEELWRKEYLYRKRKEKKSEPKA